MLSNALYNLNRPLTSSQRSSEPLANLLETEILKCLKSLFTSDAGASDALGTPQAFTALASCLASPQLPARRQAAEFLVFLLNREKPRGLTLVMKGLADLQRAHGAMNPFEVWFRFFENAIDGRGKMGSVVGASDAVMSLRGHQAREYMREAANNPPANGIGATPGAAQRTRTNSLKRRSSASSLSSAATPTRVTPNTPGTGSTTQLDVNLSDYAVVNLLLATSILTNVTDLVSRVHYRTQMETAGLRRIFDKLEVLEHPTLKRIIGSYKLSSQGDDADLAEDMKEDVRMNFSDPQEIMRAVLENVEGRSRDHLLSVMKHLLLVPKDDELRLRYLQLIDNLVSAVVTDRRGIDGDLTSLLGTSVAQLTSRFADGEKLDAALDDARLARAQVAQMRRDREELELKIAQKDSGLVGELTDKLKGVENALQTSRGVSESLKTQMVSAERAHREQITVLEIQVRELFKMLKEARALEDIVADESTVLDRRELMGSIEKSIQRTKTVQRLEGGARVHVSPASDPRSSMSPRKSRFADAPEEAVRQHIETSLLTDQTTLVRPCSVARLPPR